MDAFNDGLGPTAWSLFSATGGVGYYLLYKELTGAHDNENQSKRLD